MGVAQSEEPKKTSLHFRQTESTNCGEHSLLCFFLVFEGNRMGGKETPLSKNHVLALHSCPESQSSSLI